MVRRMRRSRRRGLSASSVAVYARRNPRLHARRPRSKIAGRRYQRGGRLRTRTTTRSRRPRKQLSSGAEYSRLTTTFGRYGRKTVSQAFKELRAGQFPLKLRWSAVNPFGTSGFLWMNNRTMGGFRVFPMYAFNLTSGPQFQGGYAPCLQYSVNTSTNFGNWNLVIGQDQNSAPAVNWTVEDNPSGNSAVLGAKSLMKWASIKMNCYGCKNKPTRWLIQIIQVKDEDIDPFRSLNELNDDVIRNMSQFWGNMVKQFTYNPISTIGSEHKRLYRVIKSMSFIQDPQMSIDNDQTPKIKTVNMFVKMNQLCKWDINKTPVGAVANIADNANYVTENAAQQDWPILESKYTKILLIRALNAGEDTSDSTNETPSFDINVRTCHVKMQS